MCDVDLIIPRDKYKPVSYEYWLMLKELEPTKFFYDYDDYVKSKQEQCEAELENKKNCSAELKAIRFIVDIRNRSTYEKAIKAITEIEQNPLFKEWMSKDELDFLYQTLGKITN